MEKFYSFNRIWKYFCKIKLALLLIIFLAFISILGTIIPQEMKKEEYLKLFNKEIYFWFKTFSLTDIYHSWWYETLLVILSINLLICTLDRFPLTWKIIRNSKGKIISSSEILNLSVNKKIEDIKCPGTEIEKILKRFHYRVTLKPDSIFAEKAKFSYLGSYITHLSIIVIFIGAIVGLIFGAKGYLSLDEGKMTSIFNQVYFHNGERVEKTSDLGFLIKAEKIDLELYLQRGIPKDYITELVVFENGKEVKRRNVEVNHPLSYKGMTLYQSGYGIIYPEAVVLKLVEKDNQKETVSGEISINTLYEVPGSEWKLKPVSFYPDFLFDKGRLVNLSNSPNNPALELEIWREEKKIGTFIIFPRYSNIQPEDFPYNIYLEKLRAKEYTVLKVTKDPGVYIVYLGCILIISGVFLSFYFAHQRIWIIIENKNLYIGGITSKNKFIFQKEFDKITEKIEGAG